MNETIQAYRRDGVVKISGLLDGETIASVREALTAYLRDTLPHVPAADFVKGTDGDSVRNLWRMDRHAPFFAALARDTRILDVVAPFVNGDPVLMSVETFNKPARHGSGVPPHQDNAYFNWRVETGFMEAIAPFMAGPPVKTLLKPVA